MNVLVPCLASALALAAVTSTFAAESNKANVYRDYTDTVAPANQEAYEAGVKAWNQCLKEHGSKYAWIAWNHETGSDTYTYSYVSGPNLWGDFDTMRSAFKACDSTWRKQAAPHLKRESSAFMEFESDMSNLPASWRTDPPPAMLQVLEFTLKSGHEANESFRTNMKKFAAAAAKAKWPYHFQTVSIAGGGDGSPDYLIVIPTKNWADAGSEPNPTFWKMVEGVYGKTDAEAMRKSFNDAIAKSSGHFDSYSADLSYIPSK